MEGGAHLSTPKRMVSLRQSCCNIQHLVEETGPCLLRKGYFEYLIFVPVYRGGHCKLGMVKGPTWQGAEASQGQEF